MLSFIIIIS